MPGQDWKPSVALIPEALARPNTPRRAPCRHPPGVPPHTAVLRFVIAPVSTPMGKIIQKAMKGMTARPRSVRCGGAERVGQLGRVASRCARLRSGRPLPH